MDNSSIRSPVHNLRINMSTVSRQPSEPRRRGGPNKRNVGRAPRKLKHIEKLLSDGILLTKGMQTRTRDEAQLLISEYCEASHRFCRYSLRKGEKRTPPPVANKSKVRAVCKWDALCGFYAEASLRKKDGYWIFNDVAPHTCCPAEDKPSATNYKTEELARVPAIQKSCSDYTGGFLESVSEYVAENLSTKLRTKLRKEAAAAAVIGEDRENRRNLPSMTESRKEAAVVESSLENVAARTNVRQDGKETHLAVVESLENTADGTNIAHCASLAEPSNLKQKRAHNKRRIEQHPRQCSLLSLRVREPS